jgi:anti-sigma regulatory factor (Ser/Thr protein kinase)
VVSAEPVPIRATACATYRRACTMGAVRTAWKDNPAVELRTALRNDPGEVERARNLIGASMRRWGVPDDDGVAVLLVSELVSNALRYGAQPMRMVARHSGANLRVEVHDARGGEPPRLRREAPESANGRGMMLVDALAARWGWSEFGGDKQVWFELDLTPAAPALAVEQAPAGRVEQAPAVDMPAVDLPAADTDEIVAA